MTAGSVVFLLFRRVLFDKVLQVPFYCCRRVPFDSAASTGSPIKICLSRKLLIFFSFFILCSLHLCFAGAAGA